MSDSLAYKKWPLMCSIVHNSSVKVEKYFRNVRCLLMHTNTIEVSWTTKPLYSCCAGRKEQTFEARITGGLQVLWECCYGNERENIKPYFACVCLYIRSEYGKCSKERYVGSWGECVCVRVCVWGGRLMGVESTVTADWSWSPLH